MTTATATKPKKTIARKITPSANLKIPSTEVNLGDEIVVPLAELWMDPENDRIQSRVSPAEIDELAQAIARFGLQHPIQVTRLGAPQGKWRVVFGHRRVQACRRIGATDIVAHEAPYQSEGQLREARAVENVQRKDLHPMEEAVAVARLLDSEAERMVPGKKFDQLPPEQKKATVMRVSVRLAKPEQWIRDRSFMSRLDGKTRDLVLEGKLPFGHAREIAKLADPRARDELAQRAAAGAKRGWGQPREEPMPIEEVREEVSKSLFSLAQVPWKMDVPFAGCPACADCPSNSANNPGLFEHGTRFSRDRDEARRSHGGQGKSEPVAGVCTNHVCFGKKNAAAGQAVARAASAAAKLVREAPAKKRDQVKREAVWTVTPEFLERSVVKHKYETRQRAGKSAAKTRANPDSHRPAAPKPEEVARGKLEEARRARAKKTIGPALARLFRLNPGAWSVFKLFTESKLYEATQHYNAKKRERAIASPEMAALLKRLKDPSWDSILAIEKHCGTQYGLLDDWDIGRSGMAEKIAEVLELEVGPAPKLEDFMPAKGKEKPAASGSAEKRANAAKASKAEDELDDADGEVDE